MVQGGSTRRARLGRRAAVLLVLLAPLAPGGAGTRAQIVFEVHTEADARFPIGPACDAPGCFTRGDFNGDGFDDLLVDSNYAIETKSLDLFLSTPSNLEPRAPIDSGLENVQWIATGDIDRDGALDLVVRSTNGGRILPGDGNGGFPAAPIELPAIPSFDRGVILVDLDGDGRLDLVTGRRFFLGGPGAAFGEPVLFDGGVLPMAGDLDRDGRPEICVSQVIGRDAEVRVLRYASGEGLVRELTFLTDSSPRFLADLDGDLAPDLVLGESFIACTGDGGFADLPMPLPLRVEALADFNGDGALDILGYLDGRGGVSLGDGAGSFSTPAVLPTLAERTAVTPLDADMDGHVDLVVGRWGLLSVFRGDGSGSFAAPPGFFSFGEPGRYLPPGPVHDYDRDGHLDLFLRGDFHLGGGDGSFTRTPADAVVPGLGAWVADGTGFLAIADVDGNGADDYVRTYPSLEVFGFLWGETDGTFTPGPGSDLPQSGSYFLNPTVAIADFNRDGLLDLAGTGSSEGQQVLVFDNLGGRRFAEPRLYAIPNKMNATLEPGDFNGDGAPDLFVLYDGTKILFNKGDGTFLDEEPLFLEREWPGAIMDFDRNGVDDLLYYYAGVLLMAPVGSPEPTQLPGTIRYPESYRLAAAADLSGDGHLDLVLQGGPPPTLLFIDGTDVRGAGETPIGTGSIGTVLGTFGGGVPVESPDWLQTVLSGDFNEDGAVDLAGVADEGFYVFRNLSFGPSFRRGRINRDLEINMSDAVSHFGCLFTGEDSCAECLDARDVNDDGGADISDGIALLGWLFLGTRAPAEPFTACGQDLTPDALSCSSPGAGCE